MSDHVAVRFVSRVTTALGQELARHEDDLDLPVEYEDDGRAKCVACLNVGGEPARTIVVELPDDWKTKGDGRWLVHLDVEPLPPVVEEAEVVRDDGGRIVGHRRRFYSRRSS